MPMLAYIIDMYVRTDGTYGVNEGLLASVLPALVFAVFSVQPLTIVGGTSSSSVPRSSRGHDVEERRSSRLTLVLALAVTGLINLFNYTTFDILRDYDVNYIQFQAWVLMCAPSLVAAFAQGPSSPPSSSPLQLVRHHALDRRRVQHLRLHPLRHRVRLDALRSSSVGL